MLLFALMHVHVTAGRSPTDAISTPHHDLALLGVLQFWTLVYAVVTAVLLWRGRATPRSGMLRAEQAGMAGGALLMAFTMT